MSERFRSVADSNPITETETWATSLRNL